MMYHCKYCGNNIDSDDKEEFCNICGRDCLVVWPEQSLWEKEESHHIHPRFMDNPNGGGQIFPVWKNKHDKLHGLIMTWVWECIREDDKKKTIEYVISKSKEFLGVKD